jgi:Fic family protein
MKTLGFDLRSEAALTTVTSDVITSSAIEGESLDPEQVRSSVARHLYMAKCSTDTALRDIRDLVKHGILTQNPGGGRSTSYRLAAKDEL